MIYSKYHESGESVVVRLRDNEKPRAYFGVKYPLAFIRKALGGIIESEWLTVQGKIKLFMNYEFYFAEYTLDEINFFLKDLDEDKKRTITSYTSMTSKRAKHV